MSTAADTTLTEINLPELPSSKFERERRAFYRRLPDLLKTHAGLFVAIHEEQVVDFGPDQAEVALRVLQRVGSVPIFVHRVGDESSSPCRSGLRRDLSTRGTDE